MTTLPSLSLLNQINQFIRERRGIFSLNYGLFLLSWKSGLRVSEAVSFNYQLKHPRHKDLYLVKGKGKKERYVYVSKEVIKELKVNNWKPNQTNRFSFGNFLKKVKEKINIPGIVELTPHTLRRCFTTHNALNGVPMPILQKALGHANIRTTSGYWKGSVDIREFGGWLKPDFSPKEPEGVPEMKKDDDPQLPKMPQIPARKERPLILDDSKEPGLLKVIEKLKEELEERDRKLREKDSEVSFLTSENETLKAIDRKKDQKLAKYRRKLKDLSIKNNSLIENYVSLKNTAKNQGKIKEKQQQEFILDNFLLNGLSKTREKKKNPLVVREKQQTELIAEIQVWKPPN